MTRRSYYQIVVDPAQREKKDGYPKRIHLYMVTIFLYIRAAVGIEWIQK